MGTENNQISDKQKLLTEWKKAKAENSLASFPTTLSYQEEEFSCNKEAEHGIQTSCAAKNYKLTK
jgi:hypothetical protein